MKSNYKKIMNNKILIINIAKDDNDYEENFNSTK